MKLKGETSLKLRIRGLKAVLTAYDPETLDPVTRGKKGDIWGYKLIDDRDIDYVVMGYDEGFSSKPAALAAARAEAKKIISRRKARA